MVKRALLAALAVAAVGAASCWTHHTIKFEPIEIKPIHATIDINLKVDRQLDQFFDFEKQPGKSGEKPAEKK
jgi:hypothetical protein